MQSGLRFYSKVLVFLIIVMGVTNHTSAQPTNKGLKVITLEKIKTHIDYLASDSLKGRNTPSAGLELAAKYIETKFRSYGLNPVNNSYSQPVPIVSLSLGNKNALTISRNGELKKLNFKSHFIPFEMSADTTVKAEVIFAGYGITAPDYHFDDYKNIDVKGKIVLILSHEPGENEDSSLFMGKKASQYSDIKYKVENAIEHGAAGILLITDPNNHLLVIPRGYAWPTLTDPKNENLAIILRKNEKPKAKIPVFHIGQESIEILLGSIDSLKQLQTKIDISLTPNSFALKNIFVEMQSSVIEKDLGCRNVVGFIQGTDPKLKDEIMIIGAHYDHVGISKTHIEGEDFIYNGADDNASGTTSLLAVAEAFAQMKTKPRRSVLFIAFTGEEKGLFGSKSYISDPLFPLEKTIAMLNADMVGRNSPDTLLLEAGGLSPDLTQVVKKANEEIGFQLITDETKFSGGSDHAPFYYKKIPFVFFFAGLHNDYHTVRDNPDLINHAKLVKVSKLIFKTAWEIASSDQYYKLLEKTSN